MAYQGIKSLSKQHFFIEKSFQALLYSNHRHHTPLVVVKKILDYMNLTHKEPYGEALDVGCGSGQSTQVLCPYFKKVLGVDACDRNIIQANVNKKFCNSTYYTAYAEEIPTIGEQFHLITACQSLHWFNPKLFFAEADRLLVPGGVLAAYGYTTAYPVEGNNDLKDKLYEYLSNFSNVEDNEKRTYALNSLQDEKFNLPFENLKSFDQIEFVRKVSGKKYIGYLQASQGYRNYALEHGEDAAEALLFNYISKVKTFLRTREDFDTAKFDVKCVYYLRMTTKPK